MASTVPPPPSAEVVRQHVAALRASGKDLVADSIEALLAAKGILRRNEQAAHFEVQSAGELEVGSHTSSTGSAKGLSFAASWGRYGYAGGVMDLAEIRRLVAHLLAYLTSPD